ISKMLLTIVISFAALCCSGTNAEVFTSMTDMSKLLTTQEEMIRAVDNYILAQEEKIQRLKKELRTLEEAHDVANRAPERFLGNPINAYLLVKRLTVDWNDLKSVMTDETTGSSTLQNLTSMAQLLRWPDEEDLHGVAMGLMRLQDTYKLETSQMAKGLIFNIPAQRELTAAECFELGRQSYNSGDHYHTMLWMNEALNRQEIESNKTVLRGDILEYLAFSTYMQGNIRQALKLTDELLLERPNHQRALGNKLYYHEALQKQQEEQRGETADIDPETQAVDQGYSVTEDKGFLDEWQRERVAYERLCRGEGKVSEDMKKKLTCFYQFGPGKFLRIAPVKTEVMHIHPTIYIYYDVLYEKEMAVIKELAIPRFKRATVQNYKTGELETAQYRISKSAWLKDEDHLYVRNVNQRIEDISGLAVSTAEELQIANYGIGGHYEPHFDFARAEEKDAFKSLGTGNRIATFLFYMTDIEAGGATVFPHLNLALWPKAGAAAFWHNLLPGGEGDVLTRHAACPVLVGSKWVSNKWIHEAGQERRRPCQIDKNALENVGDHFRSD
ncbi:unnamed protein product, partial [Meganyctiphanes norvegica]